MPPHCYGPEEDSWRVKADYKGTGKLFYSLVKGDRTKRQRVSYAIKDKDEVLLTDSRQIADRWRQYFNDLLNVPNDQVNHEEEENDGWH